MHASWEVEYGAPREGAFNPGAYLSARQVRVEALLLAHLEGLSPSASPLVRRALCYSLLSESQRRRAVLCLAVAEAVAGTRAYPRVVEDTVYALELLLTCSRVHEELRALDDGEAMAAEIGDALILEAFHVLSAGVEPVRARLCRELAAGTGLMGTAGGQVADLVKDSAARRDYLRELNRMKSSGFIRASCRMGAIAAGAGEDVLARADTYGDAVGLAFLIGASQRTAAHTGRLTFAAVLSSSTSRTLAVRKVTEAIAAIQPLEGSDGPLAGLARYALQWSSPDTERVQ